ncbi:MAG: hypothetical protein AB8I69_21965 [Anaerolineae bacterium]
MRGSVWNRLRRLWWVVLLLALAGGVWLLPISGGLMVILGEAPNAPHWPVVNLSPASPKPDQTVDLWVTDVQAFPYVKLVVDGVSHEPVAWPSASDDTLIWKWQFVIPMEGAHRAVLYHDCHTGCVEWKRINLQANYDPPSVSTVPTKLGVVFADPGRDWHGRSGWAVELTYARLSNEAYWGIDDLAVRVHQVSAKGLRVLVRVDYAQGQSVPPAGDEEALAEYLAYLRRLARDDRLGDVYGYILGSSYNSLDSNTLSQNGTVTPEWYARVFNGYGEGVSRTDNAVQVIRAENSSVRVLVGSVRPWNGDSDGERQYAIDVPWLNYMNTLAALLDEAAQAKASAGIPLAAPDGFAVHASGRPEAPELAGQAGSEEPRIDLRRSEWDGAQAGFRVYRDWLDIINAYPTTRGLPVYITTVNTYIRDEGVLPSQNYPSGWLTTALEMIDDEPQVHALCWFIDDFPHDTQWDQFSLTQHPGRLADAAAEFDELLK